jgi:glucuronoarabinoxylan endo-1,4-beta-xylanase
VENYVNVLNTAKIYGIAHHLYHGANESDPYSSSEFAKVGNYKPQIPHFQTEYSRGDWFPMAGMIFKSLNDENAVAYLFWDLIWDNGGLVDLDFPWDASRWSNPKGFTRTKYYFVFKQFSAWIHPGWKRIKVSTPSVMVKTLAFISADMDSATFVAINTSSTTSYPVKVTVPGYSIDQSVVTRTSTSEDGVTDLLPADSVLLKPKSITTVAMKIKPASTSVRFNPVHENMNVSCQIYPNPFREKATLKLNSPNGGFYSFTILDLMGRIIAQLPGKSFTRGEHLLEFGKDRLLPGNYILRIDNKGHIAGRAKFMIIP